MVVVVSNAQSQDGYMRATDRQRQTERWAGGGGGGGGGSGGGF